MICIEIIRYHMDEWNKISELNDSYIIIYIMYMRCCNCEKWIETVHTPFDYAVLNFLNFNINFALIQDFLS